MGTRVLAGALAAVMVLAGTAKLLGGHSAAYALPHWAYYASALCECAAPVLVWRRQDRLLGVLAVGVAAAGIAIDLLQPGRTCGCLGPWLEDPWLQWLARGIVGLLGVLVLWTQERLPKRSG
jgi:hypothetical protein